MSELENKDLAEQTEIASPEGAEAASPAEKAISYPDMLTVSPNPHMKDDMTTRRIMLKVIVALLPAAIWGVYAFGLRAAAILVLATASAVLFEFLAQKVLKKSVTVADCSAAVTGLLIGMNLSPTVPLWLPVAGSFFAIVVVKQLFGGIGKNIVNPALAARVFMFAWPMRMGAFSSFGERISSLSVNFSEYDAVSSATPLASLKQGALPTDVTYFDMFLGKTGGTIGEISALLLILGGLYLLFSKVITWHIPVAYIGTVALLCFIFPRSDARLDFMLCEILAGGLMLGAFFMATDYATSPVTPKGRLIYGVGCGLITVFIRYFGGYPEGVSFSILIMNLLAWYIDKATVPKRFGGKSDGKK
jgi:electron transport complex protein RnfD